MTTGTTKKTCSEEKQKKREQQALEIWNEMFERLVQFKMKYNHCEISVICEVNSQLGGWAKRQREFQNNLSKFKFEKLNDLGFEWNPWETQWNKIYAELVKYKLKNNDCNVPNTYSENPPLGLWVSSQRTSRTNNKLSEHKIKQLNDIGFIWSIPDFQWDIMYKELIKYKLENDDCNVPTNYLTNPSLGSWVGYQKSLKNKNKLSVWKIKKLNDLGFVWIPPNTIKWDKMYGELVRYKLKNNDCKVPHVYEENPQLGFWVTNQRQYKKQSALSDERIKKLNDIGFVWQLRN